MLCKNPSTYFVVLASSVKTSEFKVIECHRKGLILQVGLPVSSRPMYHDVYFSGGCDCVIFIDYDPASGTHVAEANTPADTRNSDNTVSILGQHLDNWHNIDVVPALTCERRKHIYTEALKRNDKKIFV